MGSKLTSEKKDKSESKTNKTKEKYKLVFDSDLSEKEIKNAYIEYACVNSGFE